MSEDFSKLYETVLALFRAEQAQGPIRIGPLAQGIERLFSAHGFRTPASGRHIRQILVLRLDELGDLVLTSAFFRELRRNHPEARITVAVNPRWLDAVALAPYFNQVHGLDTLQLQEKGNALQTFAGLLDFAREQLWPEHYDLCVVPRFDHDRYLAGMLGLLSGARQRIGYAENVTPWKQKLNRGFDAFYTQLLPGGTATHEVERSLSVLRALGSKVQSDKLEAWTAFDDERWAEELLAGDAAPVAAFSPGGSGSNRSWPLERYAELAGWLAQKQGMRIVVLGTAGEADAGRYLAQRLPETVTDLCGRTTVRQMTALLRRCRVYIGRDTGTKHLAAAAGIPVVEISSCPAGASADNHFSSPVRFGPWGVDNRILRPAAADAACAGGCRSNQPHCILSVSVEQVRQAVESVLGARQEALAAVSGKLPAEVSATPDPHLRIGTPARRDTWTAALRRFDAEQTERKKQDPAAAMAAADEFYLDHLKRIRPEQALRILPALTEAWLSHRRLPHRFGAVSPAERQRLVDISEQLRVQLTSLLQGDLLLPGRWSERQQQQWVSMWRLLFLSPFSPLALSRNGKPEKQGTAAPTAAPATMQTNETPDSPCFRMRRCLLQSLYMPHASEELNLDIQALFDEPAPVFLKAIVGSWLVETEYFGVTEADRRRVCHYASRICEEMLRPAEWLTFGAFAVLIEEMMAAFWRISYAGGDSKRELSLLGDAVTFRMNRFFPQPRLAAVPKDSAREPLRIGYVSRNFCKQAVAFYMVNRLIHHDRKRFELHTFAIGEREDELTTVFRENSDVFERHAQLSDFAGMIRKLLDSRLDILVYADLGMDPFTLMLAGLRLAPVQCVLVGHGVTSGMPNIDYYISGDFEPEDADRYYREKLVRLPGLGAAQYPPYEPEKYPTRQDYKIPGDAVVYVSCANGIKIHPDQDRLFLEILRRVPNAWLVLKPFQTPDAVDPKFMERLFVPARAAGVAGRILIVPPFRQARDVLGLLRFADIQLDTYPYGGWTTNMEAVYMGLPIVTQEGDMARSRWGAAMLRAMGIGDGIARTGAEYVDQAVRLGLDAKLREQVRGKIRENAASLFFEGASAQPAYEEMLVNCYNEKIGMMKK